MTRAQIEAALEAELKKLDEWYGLDNWSLKEVVDFVLDRFVQ